MPVTVEDRSRWEDRRMKKEFKIVSACWSLPMLTYLYGSTRGSSVLRSRLFLTSGLVSSISGNYGQAGNCITIDGVFLWSKNNSEIVSR